MSKVCVRTSVNRQVGAGIQSSDLSAQRWLSSAQGSSRPRYSHSLRLLPRWSSKSVLATITCFSFLTGRELDLVDIRIAWGGLETKIPALSLASAVDGTKFSGARLQCVFPLRSPGGSEVRLQPEVLCRPILTTVRGFPLSQLLVLEHVLNFSCLWNFLKLFSPEMPEMLFYLLK